MKKSLHPLRYVSSAALAAALAIPATARAQTSEPAAASNEVVAAEGEGTSDTGAVSGTTETRVRVCSPPCRSGFSCLDGRCVSACNPECPGGETCTSEGMCVSREELRYGQTVRRHDRFFLRLELGIGYLTGSRSEQIFDDDPRLDGRVTGIAQVGALMLGGTVADGLVLGGGSFGTNAPSARYSGDVDPRGAEPPFVENDVRLTLTSVSIVGPFLACYPDPTQGLHADLAAGLALASLGSYYDGERFSVSGFGGAGWGLVLGGGLDFWIGEQWSLGVLARLSYADVWNNSDIDDLNAWVPAFAFAATYH